MTTWTIIDANYLARRAFYSQTGALDNGTIFGFLRDMAAACEYLRVDGAAFCFDSTTSERRRVFVEYKYSRNARLEKMKPEEFKRESEFHEQVGRLMDILRRIGYRNVFHQRGYEADDLIANCCNYFPGDKILVSADQDLWQLLRPGVRCWNPQQKKMTDESVFRNTWGLAPADWVLVKAIAGCSGDDIPGVAGVGEKTAAAYLRRELAAGAKRDAIKRFVRGEIYDLNQLLIRLPYPGCMECKPQPGDSPTVQGWTQTARELEMPLLAEFSGALRRKRVEK